jgi:hypothetical protein
LHILAANFSKFRTDFFAMKIRADFWVFIIAMKIRVPRYRSCARKPQEKIQGVKSPEFFLLSSQKLPLYRIS